MLYSRLATLYFFSIEFGLCSAGADECVQNGACQKDTKGKSDKPSYKVYGAGLLSSAGELQVIKLANVMNSTLKTTFLAPFPLAYALLLRERRFLGIIGVREAVY